METNQKNFGVIWLDKTGFNFCLTTGQAPIRHEFGPGVLSYLEIIDETKLEEDVKLFAEQAKIPPSALIVVLGQDILFEQEILVTSEDQLKKDQQQFLESVPFEDVYSKTWRTENKVKIVACNADLFNSLRMVTNKLGFSVAAAIPYFNVGSPTLDASVAKDLWGKVEALKVTSLVDSQENQVKKDSTEIQQQKTKHSPRELILVGIFIVLAIGFCIVVYLQYFAQK